MSRALGWNAFVTDILRKPAAAAQPAYSYGSRLTAKPFKARFRHASFALPLFGSLFGASLTPFFLFLFPVFCLTQV